MLSHDLQNFHCTLVTQDLRCILGRIGCWLFVDVDTLISTLFKCRLGS